MDPVAEDYLRWFYDNNKWKFMQYRGVRISKLPSDVWNYQEIFHERDIHWVVETGTHQGGSALFFADMLDARKAEGIVISVDVAPQFVTEYDYLHKNPRISFLTGDSAGPEMVTAIHEKIKNRTKPLFMILDSDHRAHHVRRELEVLVPLLRAGDYLLVEDTIVCGHPVRMDHGPGPWEAIEDYKAANPDMLIHDTQREEKFGCSFATNGYYIKA